MSRSQFMVRVWIWKICVRDSRSGSPNSTFLSRRPGRSNAGSRVSGLFVAISTCIVADNTTFNAYRQQKHSTHMSEAFMLRTLLERSKKCLHGIILHLIIVSSACHS